MAINKKLIHFKNKEAFDRELQAGNIMDTSICWIPDAKFIYTRGTYWYCSSKSDAEIQQLLSNIETQLNNKVDKVEGSTLIPETKLALIDTNASDIDALEVRVAANEAKLVGITTTVVSTINTAIDAAMAWHEVTE